MQQGILSVVPIIRYPSRHNENAPERGPDARKGDVLSVCAVRHPSSNVQHRVSANGGMAELGRWRLQLLYRRPEYIGRLTWRNCAYWCYGHKWYFPGHSIMSSVS